YSGSLMKVAAMYAAFQLRVAVNDLAATLGLPPKRDLFKKIGKTFDRQIDRAVPLINSNRALIRDLPTEAMRVPKYENIFKATQSGGRWVLDFRDTGADNFAGHLHGMIVGSHNHSAGICIRALGYSWIN